jgi:hypothetical protein
MIGKSPAVARVDTGAGTFIDSKFAFKHGCTIKGARPMTITIANGEEMQSKAACKDCQYTIYGHKFKNDFRLLELKGYDIILGTDWILTHSPMTWDYRTDSLKINYYGWKNIVFHGQVQEADCHLVTTIKMSKLLRQGAMGAVICTIKTDTTAPTITARHELVQEVLEKFQEVFHEPTQLPPNRPCDHQIVLHPGSKPVNKRPYRLPSYQKDVMESIVEQMIKSGAIKLSLSPFSSPTILVSKKDGTWPLCIDYM